MKKNSMKSALKQSLVQEAEHVEQRFDVAEKLFSRNLKENEDFQKQIKEQKSDISRQRVVRDTFSMPSSDCELIGEVKQRCLRLGMDTTRSEIVRAGIKYLSEVAENDLMEIIGKVVKLKPGRAKEYR